MTESTEYAIILTTNGPYGVSGSLSGSPVLWQNYINHITDKHYDEYESPNQTDAEAVALLDSELEQYNARYECTDRNAVVFETELDAMIFKLKWS